MDEFFDIVDEYNNIIGKAKRSECHGNPALLHRTSHVVVFHNDGRLLLQKRTQSKDIQPGKWDTAVGGHLDLGESFEEGARREMFEEIGLPSNTPLNYLFEMKIRNDIESENIAIYAATYNGPFTPQPSEVDELRFWNYDEIMLEIEKGEASCFTPNLINELLLLKTKGLLKKHPQC
jgi:isopentenyldiphosphate isomerase